MSSLIKPLAVPALPSVSKQDMFNYFIGVWTAKGVIPNPVEAARGMGGVNPAAVQAFLSEDEWRRKLVIRGLPLTKRTMLTEEQLKTLAIITNPELKGGLAARLKLAGVGHAKHSSWMNDPQYRECYNALAMQILDNALADVNMGLANSAARGDVAAVKFFYEVTGRYRPGDMPQQGQDVMQVLVKVVDIISKHVTDPVTLEKIAGEMTLLAAVAAPPKAAIKGEVL